MPAPRAEQPGTDGSDLVRHARDGLIAVRRATAVLQEVVIGLDDFTARGPSLLPGWTRGHVISHLARNADALVNLLTWAKTGIEHPMYASRADRDADIDEGAHRLLQIQQEDLTAANQRFQAAADDLPASGWLAIVGSRLSNAMVAASIPWMRLLEVLVHLVDLDIGIGYQEAVSMAGEQVETLLDFVVQVRSNAPESPALRLVVVLPTGPERIWTMGAGEPRSVRGPVTAVLPWLTGREDGNGLEGEVPALGEW